MTFRRIFSVLCLAALLSGCARNAAEQLLSADESVRQEALRRLDQMPVLDRREIVPFLAKNLAADNANVRRRAVQALARLGPDAVNPLVRALQSKDARARVAAAEALGLLGADAKGAAGPLVEAEQDADADVRMWAAVSLGKIKEAMTPSELNLFQMLYGKKETIAPPSALAASGSPKALLDSLRGQGVKRREPVVLALVAKGPLAAPAILAGLTDPEEALREAAAQALRLLTQNADAPEPPASPTEDEAALARRLGGLWSEMARHLGAGRIDQALELFPPVRREEYRTTFLSLGSALPAVGRGLDVPLAFVSTDGQTASLRGKVHIQDVPMTLRPRFAKDDKGEWKIQSF